MQKKSTKGTTTRTAKLRDELYNDAKQADALLRLLNGPIYPWLRVAIVKVLADAAQRIGHPLMAPMLIDEKLTITPNDNRYFQNLRKNLEGLIQGTWRKEFTLERTPDEKIAEAIATILQTEEAPEYLFEKVADFVTTASSGDIRRFWSVPVILHTLDFARREEARKLEETQEVPS